jgi:hypothetical protein
MNPFLESTDRWPAFHHELVAAMRQHIASGLGEQFQARIGERRYTTPPAPGATGAGVERREEYLELCEANGGALVTLVDAVSPVNKTTDAGRLAYLQTRQQAEESKANVVVIDLVLQGQPTIDYSHEGLGDWDYSVTITKSTHPERREIYFATLLQRLPRFCIPLPAVHRTIVMDLQSVFVHTLQKGQFVSQFDPKYEPRLGLKDTTRCRLDELLSQAIHQAKTDSTHTD